MKENTSKHFKKTIFMFTAAFVLSGLLYGLPKVTAYADDTVNNWSSIPTAITSSAQITLPSSTINAGDAGNHVLDISGSGTNVTITGVSTESNPYLNLEIKISGGATVTLQNVNINNKINNCSYPPVDTSGSGNKLIINGTNTLTAANGQAAVCVLAASGASLTIDGTGTLTANGGDLSAGIGSSSGNSTGTITIAGGNITAKGGSNGAGIGSGSIDSSKMPNVNILISGGNITAAGGTDSAGIGGSCTSGTVSVRITGGSVNAAGGYSLSNGGAGIGGGTSSSNAINVSISGGNITATGGTGSINGGAGIGCDTIINGSSISINGGKIKATGGSGNTPGKDFNTGNLYISGGSVDAPTMSPAPVNSADSRQLFLTILTLPASSSIDSIAVTQGTTPYSYSLSDVSIDGSNNIYLYLPENIGNDKTAIIINRSSGVFPLIYTGTVANSGSANIPTPITDLSTLGVTIDSIPDQTFTGSAILPVPPILVVRYGSAVLTIGSDYTVSYGNNIAIGVGSGTVTVSGTGNTGHGYFTGSLTTHFNIVAPPTPVTPPAPVVPPAPAANSGRDRDRTPSVSTAAVTPVPAVVPAQPQQVAAPAVQQPAAAPEAPEVKTQLDSASGIEFVAINNSAFASMLQTADTSRLIKISVPGFNGARGSIVTLPAEELMKLDSTYKLQLTTDIAVSTLPLASMLPADVKATDTVSFGFVSADPSNLSLALRRQIGTRPAVELHYMINNRLLTWNSPKVPVTIQIPYTPTLSEFKAQSNIRVLYINENGTSSILPDSHFSGITGMVTFTAAHSGRFAVTFLQSPAAPKKAAPKKAAPAKKTAAPRKPHR